MVYIEGLQIVILCLRTLFMRSVCVYAYFSDVIYDPLQCPEHLPRISKESGVNIITGTSYYVDSFVAPDAKLLSVQEVR